MDALEAMGLGGFWRTGDFAYDAEVKKAFGFAETDAIVAVLYIGSVGQPGKPRPWISILSRSAGKSG